jgi:hypothetical protein
MMLADLHRLAVMMFRPILMTTMAVSIAFAQGHPQLPHRVLHAVSPAELEAICPGAFACATPDWHSGICHVYVPNLQLPGWPSRRDLLAHELRHCNGRGQD